MPARPQRAAARQLRRDQLRRTARIAARQRALRPRGRRVHRRERRASASSSMRTAARCSSTRSRACRWRVQVKLLRVLQERSIERLGSNEEHPGRLPRDRRHQGRSEGAVRAGTISRRPVLPARRGVASSCRRCASGARTSRCCSSTSRCRRRGATSRPRRSWIDRRCAALMAASTAGQRARAAQRGRSLRPRPARRRVLPHARPRRAEQGLPEQMEHIERASSSRSSGSITARRRRLPRPSAYRNRRSMTSFAGCVSRRRSFGRTRRHAAFASLRCRSWTRGTSCAHQEIWGSQVRLFIAVVATALC